jgi:hypothetical protein
MIGKITGRTIAKNRDGDVDRILLQVEVIPDEDVRTVELFTQAGDDTNPGNGCRVNIVPISNSYHVGIGVSDDLVSECDAGEKEFYSTDSPVTVKKARLKLDKNSNVILNSGTNHATQQEALQIAVNTFLISLNSQLTGVGAPGGLTLNLSSAKVTTVRLP